MPIMKCPGGDVELDAVEMANLEMDTMAIEEWGRGAPDVRLCAVTGDSFTAPIIVKQLPMLAMRLAPLLGEKRIAGTDPPTTPEGVAPVATDRGDRGPPGDDDGGGGGPRKMLNMKEVLAIVRVHRRTLFRMVDEGRFPKGRWPSPNRCMWYEDEVTAWQRALPDQRKKAKKAR
jgi:predicted DNA-binding transcriptional regulator AlpA